LGESEPGDGIEFFDVLRQSDGILGSHAHTFLYPIPLPPPFAADPPTGAIGSADDQPASNAQLVQAMAGFDGGSAAGEGLNAAPLSADTSQQTLLTTPQHA
jgi:hypothetical protein